MGKNLDNKKVELENLYNDITANSEKLSAVVFNYSEIDSNGINEIRSQLFESQSKLKVLKNTLIKKLFANFGVELDDKTTSMNAVVYTQGNDFIAPVKTLNEFIKKNKKGQFTIGILDNQVITEKQVTDLADLPSFEILVGKFIGTLNSPANGFVRTLNGVQSKFVRVLSEVSKQK